MPLDAPAHKERLQDPRRSAGPPPSPWWLAPIAIPEWALATEVIPGTGHLGASPEHVHPGPQGAAGVGGMGSGEVLASGLSPAPAMPPPPPPEEGGAHNEHQHQHQHRHDGQAYLRGMAREPPAVVITEEYVRKVCSKDPPLGMWAYMTRDGRWSEQYTMVELQEMAESGQLQWGMSIQREEDGLVLPLSKVGDACCSAGRQQFYRLACSADA